jgi:hypothetical protein
MRSVPEWIGRDDSHPVPNRVKARVFERFHGICGCGCGRKIVPGDGWDTDHIIPLCNGKGLNRESNLQPMIVAHHRKKTKDDMALKRYNDKRKYAWLGLKPRRKSRPIFGSKASGWKITFSRGAVRR